MPTPNPDAINALRDWAASQSLANGAPTPESPAGDPPTPEVAPSPAGEIPTPGDWQSPLNREQIEAYAQLDNMLRADPRLGQVLSSYIQTGQVPSGLMGPAGVPPATPEPEPAEPVLPDEIANDPALKALWDSQASRIAELQGRIDEIEPTVTQATQYTQARAAADANAVATRAMQRFREDMELSEVDVQALRLTAARMLPAFNPDRDPDAAVYNSMLAAYRMDQTFFGRELEREARRQREEQQRKGRLGALSGSSGQGPRAPTPPPQPGTAEWRQAMINEVAAAMNGSFVNPDEQ